MSFEVEWGMPRQTDPPNRDEIKRVASQISHSAKGKRVFEMYLTKAMYEWLLNNMRNACIELIHREEGSPSLKDHHVVIGIDKKTVSRYISRI